ncbi:MAG: trigger factor, partial [Alphaproteobacteria bacterium]|nr:trigger factor [Alphaproteobacteria bacterium]
GHKAALGDQIAIDFLGTVDGEAFEGGKGEGMAVTLGSGQLIPGFEDQLVGAKQGDTLEVKVDFPEDYNVNYLKGKPAVFHVKVQDVRIAKPVAVDDDFAQSLGLEGLDQLRTLLKGNVEQELNNLTRTHMKRQLLDELSLRHSFDVPMAMVDAEFEQIWSQLEQEASREPNPAEARAEMERDRADYRRIAERRVRLGLLLSEIGQSAGIDISSQEMNMLVAQAAQQYPAADRERFVQYIQNEPLAAAQLRAPLYEDKVVDHLFSTANISERTVTRSELEAAIEVEEGHVHDEHCGHHQHDHKGDQPAAKKAAPKKKSTTSETVKADNAEVTSATAVDKPANKPAAKKPAPKKAKAE